MKQRRAQFILRIGFGIDGGPEQTLETAITMAILNPVILYNNYTASPKTILVDFFELKGIRLDSVQ